MTTRSDIPADQNGLPDGWSIITLGDVCAINPPKPRTGMVVGDTEVTFVPMPAVDADSGTIATPQIRRFDDVRKGFTAFRDNDVIMAKITPCMENGKAAFATGLRNGLGFGSTEFHVFRSRGAVLPEYVYYFIRQESFRSAAEMEMTGSVGQKRVPADFVQGAEIPIPPLVEQKRIVEAIGLLTARVDAARARLARVPTILKRFRQAVLAAACSGGLTEDWRGTRPNGSARDGLLDRVDKSRRKLDRAPRVEGVPSDLEGPEGWEPAYFGNLLTSVTSGSRGWARFYSDDGPFFIRSQDINTDWLDITNVAHVNPPVAAERERTRVRSGDVLITITGANVTKCAVVDIALDEAYVSQHVSLSRLALPQMAPFVHLWLVSPHHGRKVLLDAAYGAGKPGLNLDNIKEVPVAVPPLEEQDEIVRRVAALMKLADAIEQRVAIAAARADKSTQAILAKAFRGELVPTEADLARAEGRTYESAAELIARIQSAKHAAPSKRRGVNGRPKRRPKR